MADFSDKMKKAWLKSMEAIGNTAGNIASNTRYKVNEMTLLNRRREILSDFGARAYDLWQKGETFPEELARQLEELSQMCIRDRDYTGVMDEILHRYTSQCELTCVKTTHMGSLFRLTYNVTLRSPNLEKPLIDELRCRNGNLEISVSKQETQTGEL